MKLKTLLNNLEGTNVIVLNKNGSFLQEIWISEKYYGGCCFEDSIINKISAPDYSDSLYVHLKS